MQKLNFIFTLNKSGPAKTGPAGPAPTLMLLSPQSWTQLWYADDASAGGLLSDLRDWFSLLCSRGPHYGYFPEPSKCFARCFVVVAPSRLSLAREVFGYLGVWVVTGHRFLGGFIGARVIDRILYYRKFFSGVVMLEHLLLWLHHGLRLLLLPLQNSAV